MKSQIVTQTMPKHGRRLSLLAATALIFAVGLNTMSAGRNPNPGILPAGSTAYGKTLGAWNGEWWKRAIEHPIIAGSPFLEGGCFELSGHVWALAAPYGSATYECRLPAGKALFVGTLGAECSSLEPEESGFHGDTEEEQAECANYWADHVVNLSVEIDGVPVKNLASYRVVSPQISFTAPSPWIFGSEGGTGTAVAAGYCFMLAPLSKGVHSIRIRGAVHFAVAEGDPFDLDLDAGEVIFRLTVE